MICGLLHSWKSAAWHTKVPFTSKLLDIPGKARSSLWMSMEAPCSCTPSEQMAGKQSRPCLSREVRLTLTLSDNTPHTLQCATPRSPPQDREQGNNPGNIWPKITFAVESSLTTDQAFFACASSSSTAVSLSRNLRFASLSRYTCTHALRVRHT